MTEPLAPAELVNPEELVALRRDAQRYRWLRTHAVRIQGSEIWYAGDNPARPSSPGWIAPPFVHVDLAAPCTMYYCIYIQ